MQKDWRLTNQMNYLYQATLVKSVYNASGNNDHDHCEFCFDKFGESDGLQKSGYCTIDRYRWICNECFQDFQEQFEWQLVDG